MDDLLSIVIPAYNIEKYISRCLDSLINQTYHNLEIIVVNDGSTDNTSIIIDEYSHKDKRIIPIHKDNEGVSIARLVGMKKANGSYVGFVDGDDVVDNDMFELLMNNAKKYDADISHCGYVMDFPDGHSDMYYGTNKIIIQDNKTGLKDLLLGEFVEPGLWNKIYKKNLIINYINNVNMDYSIRNLEDLLVNYFMFKESNLSVYQDVCKYHYTLRKSSAATGINKNKFTDPLKVMKLLLKFNDDADLINIIYSRYISVLIFNSNQNVYKDIKKESKKILKQEISQFHQYNISTKQKYMSIGVVYLSPMYSLIRKIYEKVTGVDKKYNT